MSIEQTGSIRIDAIPEPEPDKIIAFRAANLAIVNLLDEGVDPNSRKYREACEAADQILSSD